MCIPRLSRAAPAVKPGSAKSGNYDPSGEGLPLAGWPRYSREAPADRAWSRLGEVENHWYQWRRWHEDQSDRLGCAWSNVPNFCPDETRFSDRTHGLSLTDVEREAARSLQRAALHCGSGWKAWRSFEQRGALGYDVRMVCQTHCGTRACPACAEAMRERQCARVSGPWKLFLTLTVPRFPWTITEAWHDIHTWLKEFLRELRRYIARAWKPTTAKTESGRRRWARCASEAHRRTGGIRKLEYAWVIENHKDGWPHVHMCVNTAYIDYSLVRELWQGVTGVFFANVDGKPVWDVDGTCKYLSKYVSKGVLPLDILAILKGRRLWACSIERREIPEPKWFEERSLRTDELIKQCEERETWGINEGWKLEIGKSGGYAIWIRQCEIVTSKNIEVRQQNYAEDTDAACVDVIPARRYVTSKRGNARLPDAVVSAILGACSISPPLDNQGQDMVIGL
jgi:hypothetical protein